MGKISTFLGRIARLLLRAAVVAFLVIVVGVGTVMAIVLGSTRGSYQLPADCAIVFGAAVYGHNMPGPAIVRRISTAAALYKEGSVKRLILSGGVGSGNRQSEASVMRLQAIARGVDERDIVLEEQAHSTWENVLHARPLTDNCNSVVGVSDGYHLARIDFLAWRQGWKELQTYPTVERPSEENERRSQIREIFAYLYYLLYLDVLFPTLPPQGA